MSSDIELFANLSLTRGGNEVIITAEGNLVTLNFSGFHAFCREYKHASSVAGYERLISLLDTSCKTYALCIAVKIGKFKVIAFGSGTTHLRRSIILGLISMYSKFLSA